MLDWNWFYAAFAQSIAAIAGIVGAFLVARIVSHLSDYRTLRQEIRRLRSAIHGQDRRLQARYIEWVIRRREEYYQEDRQERIERIYDAHGPQSMEAWRYVTSDLFSPYASAETRLATLASEVPGPFVRSDD